jgi:hypothetical protein
MLKIGYNIILSKIINDVHILLKILNLNSPTRGLSVIYIVSASIYIWTWIISMSDNTKFV